MDLRLTLLLGLTNKRGERERRREREAEDGDEKTYLHRNVFPRDVSPVVYFSCCLTALAARCAFTSSAESWTRPAGADIRGKGGEGWRVCCYRRRVSTVPSGVLVSLRCDVNGVVQLLPGSFAVPRYRNASSTQHLKTPQQQETNKSKQRRLVEEGEGEGGRTERKTKVCYYD